MHKQIIDITQTRTAVIADTGTIQSGPDAGSRLVFCAPVGTDIEGLFNGKTEPTDGMIAITVEPIPEAEAHQVTFVTGGGGLIKVYVDKTATEQPLEISALRLVEILYLLVKSEHGSEGVQEVH